MQHFLQIMQHSKCFIRVVKFHNQPSEVFLITSIYRVSM